MATELILTKSIEELTPALIGFNNEELMGYASRVVEKYSGRAYSDDQMQDAKDDRASIRRIMEALNSERIRIKKIYNAPMDKFAMQINQVVDLLGEALNNIDVQVKAKEAADKEKKNEALKAYFEELIGDLGSYITYEQIADPKWLNATVKEKKAQADIVAKITEINESIEVIKGLSSEDEEDLLAIYFRTLKLGQALAENEVRKKERERALEFKRVREAQQAAAIKMQEEKTVTLPFIETPAEKKEEKLLETVKETVEQPKEQPKNVFTIVLEVTGTPETMKGLMEYIKANNIAVKAMKK